MPAAARVVPLTPVDKVYTYVVPPELEAEAAVGARVVVPFGPRTLTGVIAARTEVGGPRLKPIHDVLDEAPSFSPVMLKLTRWIADYYVCAWGEVLKAALPAGATVESHRVVRGTGQEAPGLNGAAGRVLALLNEGGPQPVGTLQRGAREVTASLLRRLERDGLIAIEKELAAPSVSVRTEWRLRLADGAAAGGVRGPRQATVLEALARLQADGEAEPRQADVLAETGASSATIKSLVEKGLVERVEREVVRTPFDAAEATAPPAIHPLHAGQTTALAEIGAALDRREAKTFLLHGVTGSGKTEVYIQALKRTLAQGRTGIVLVPEIALTPQTVRRFRAHFGDRVAVLHSRMSAGERYDAWRHLQSGRFDVAIGPRSAVFAPLRNVGLVVVDEEHEASYKQFDPAPRYHARDVAVMRAHLDGAVCVLGSATPSLESYLNAKHGKYALLRMPERVPVFTNGKAGGAAELPPVEIVDLTREKKVRRLRGALSHPLREAIRDRLAKGEGVILLQNRRGYSPVVTCDDCGWTPHCRDCAVTLTFHKSHRHLRCHYCGRVERLPTACPQCGSSDLAQVGAGTQRVEEELAEVFPAARVLRMDLDTTGRKNAHQKILDAFGRGDADILIGTQMVAKGLDFARVTLVGVVDADTGLLLPDFRAAERTFQLLMQVAGRAGRGDLRGQVILQSRTPDTPALQHAARHDFLGFLRTELPDRHAFGYPPFGRLVGVEFKGPSERAVQQVAERWTGLLRQQGGAVEVLGPEPAFIGRVKKQYRFHTLVKTTRAENAYALSRLVRSVNERFGNPPKGVRINVDVDPVGLL